MRASGCVRADALERMCASGCVQADAFQRMYASACVRADSCGRMCASECVQIDACELLQSLLLAFASKLLGLCFTDEKSSGTLSAKASADPARFAILAASIEEDD
eukprot:4145588-Pleurochrysis_carterae.AAC.1